MPILKEGTISIGKIKDGLVFKNEFRFRKSHLSEETTGMVPTCEERRETMIERTIQYEGYEGQVEIQPLGWRTGYVFIPKEHPLYGCLEEKAERNIICHGGVTFVGMRKDEGGKELLRSVSTARITGTLPTGGRRMPWRMSSAA